MPALIISSMGAWKTFDEAIDPMGVCITRSVRASAFERGIPGCNYTPYPDAGSGLAHASRFCGLCGGLFQATTPYRDTNHPTKFHANPSPHCDERPKPNSNRNNSGNSKANSNNRNNSNRNNSSGNGCGNQYSTSYQKCT